MAMSGASRRVHVRISGGGNRGVLEMNIDAGGWDAVCDDGFGSAEAIAVCQTLGFSTGTTYDTTHGDAHFAVDDLDCPNSASSLSECSTSTAPYNDNCADSETVGIECSGTAECGNVHGIAYFAVDNGYEFWVNDQLVGSGNDWATTDRHTFEASCDENTVYGIDAYDEGGIASILGTIYHCDEMILTSSAWKCNPRCEDTSQTIGCTNTAAWTAPNGQGVK